MDIRRRGWRGDYSPLVRLTNPGGTPIYNAPMIASDGDRRGRGPRPRTTWLAQACASRGPADAL